MLTRRRFLGGALSSAAWACCPVDRGGPKPRLTHGVQSGDVQAQTTIQQCSASFKTATNGAGLSVNKGWFWGWGADAMSMFNTIVPPSSNEHTWGMCRFGCETCGNYSADHANITNSNSNHPGGANAAMADGSVRFVKSSIAMKVWWALGTRGGGEVLSSDSY